MDMFLNKKLWAIILFFIILFFSVSLSPQWCLSRKNEWTAEEFDMVVRISDDYNPSLYEIFTLSDRNAMNKYFTGEININGQTEKISFFPEDHFKWLRFGNNMEASNDLDDLWIVTGSFKRVYNPNKIKIIIERSYGDYFPKDIPEITLVPKKTDNTGDG